MKSRIAAMATAILTSLGSLVGLAVTTTPTTATAAPIFDPNDPFYLQQVPDGASAGQLISTQPIDPTARKILYTSTDVHGNLVPVSGVIYEPLAAWNGAVLAFAPGTQGQGDACAPSRDPLISIDTAHTAIGTGYEAPSIIAARLRGYRVVVTDYIGLGTPGVHGYLVRAEEGNALIDAARATVGGEKTPVLFYGYSQGGGAAAMAAERAASYAPDLNVVATYAGAIPANLLKISANVDESLITGALAFSFNAYYDRYPQIRETLDSLLNARGHAVLAAAVNGCVFDAILRDAFSDTRALTTTGQSFHEIMNQVPEFRAVSEANNIGHGTPARPILISTSRYDDVIPADQIYDLGRTYCSRGATVDVNTNLSPAFGQKTAFNHLGAIYHDTGVALDWLTARLHGVPAPNRCGSI